MQRIGNIDKWFLVEQDKAITFANPEPRRIRLDVNSPSPSQLFYSDGNGEITFLANVHGRDVIELRADGEFSVTVQGADCWMYTIDGEDLSFSIPDAVTLTKLIERRARNPELELMQHMLNQNIERRLNAQRDELDQLWNRREAARAAAAVVTPAPEPVVAPAPKPKSGGVPPSPAEPDGANGAGGTATSD